MKTLLFLALLFSCLTVHAQFEYGENEGQAKKNKKNYEPPKETEEITWSIKNKADSLDYELYYLRYNLLKYREQSARGRRIMVTGGIISVAFLVFGTPSSNLAIAGTAFGGTIFTIGGLINWSSAKWLKNAAIKPTRYGVSLEIPF